MLIKFSVRLALKEVAVVVVALMTTFGLHKLQKEYLK